MTSTRDDRDRTPWSGLITIARLREFHTIGLKRYGGKDGPGDPSACLDAAVGAAYSAELYTTGKRHATAGLPFSGYLIFYIALRHCFVDGNKRVAWMAAMEVLAQHGLSVRASIDEAHDMIEAVLNHQLESGEQVTAWLAPRLYSIS